MENFKSTTDLKNVAFISTRIAGTDGVSLEIEKWADIFEKEGFTCFYFAGELDRPAERCYLVPEAHFTHPDIKDVYLESFDITGRDRSGFQEDLSTGHQIERSFIRICRKI